MGTIKVAINGFGTIGKRVADAIDAQEDMEVSGVTKTGPSFGCELAIKKGFPLYCTFDDKDRIEQFSKKGYPCLGGLSDLLAISGAQSTTTSEIAQRSESPPKHR